MDRENYISYKGKEVLFPAVIQISFAPIFEGLRKMSKEDDKAVSMYATTLLEELKDYPELEEGFTDESLIEKYKKPIGKLLRFLFPDVLSSNEIKGVTVPFKFKPFFASKRFKNILEAAGKDFEISVIYK